MENDEKQRNFNAMLGLAILILVIIFAIAWCASNNGAIKTSDSQSETKATIYEPTTGLDRRLAVADSWYDGEQMLPSEELGNDPDWTIVLNGEVTDEGMLDSTLPEKNLTDSKLAESLRAHLYVDTPDGKTTELKDYLKTPVTLEAENTYVIEFDCTGYNALSPVNLNTMRYYLSPLTLKADTAAAITFAVYEAEAGEFHQICVPFQAGSEDLVIEYAIDDEFEVDADGQVHRLFFAVQNAN